MPAMRGTERRGPEGARSRMHRWLELVLAFGGLACVTTVKGITGISTVCARVTLTDDETVCITWWTAVTDAIGTSISDELAVAAAPPVLAAIGAVSRRPHDDGTPTDGTVGGPGGRFLAQPARWEHVLELVRKV